MRDISDLEKTLNRLTPRDIKGMTLREFIAEYVPTYTERMNKIFSILETEVSEELANLGYLRLQRELRKAEKAYTVYAMNHLVKGHEMHISEQVTLAAKKYNHLKIMAAMTQSQKDFRKELVWDVIAGGSLVGYGIATFFNPQLNFPLLGFIPFALKGIQTGVRCKKLMEVDMGSNEYYNIKRQFWYGAANTFANLAMGIAYHIS